MNTFRIDTTGLTNTRRWLALATLSLSILVISLDLTVLNVALPTLVRDLGASTSQLQWMVDAYTLIYAGALLTGGSLGDRFGRKRALLLGMTIFGAGSLWSAFSGSANLLIAARALMGLGAALIMPSTLSITANLFADGQRETAIGVLTGIGGIGSVVGPLLGGWLLGLLVPAVLGLIAYRFIRKGISAGMAVWPPLPRTRETLKEDLEWVQRLRTPSAR